MRVHLFPFAVALVSLPAAAGSIQAPGVIAGPDSGVTTANPAAAFYNPAALARAKGMQAMMDVQLAMVRVDVTSWRNGGFDPNTGEAYDQAHARVKVPVTFLGASYEILEDRLTAGLAITMPFVGGGDYTSSEEKGAPPYTSHQRYFGVDTKVIPAQMSPALGFTPVPDWGLHLGAAFNYTVDIISVTKTSNTGKEGLGGTMADPKPYSTDAVLVGNAKGSHMGYTVGLFFDKFEIAQAGLSYQSGGTFHAEGEAEVEFPGFLVTGGKNKKLPGEVTVDIKLPAVLRGALNSQVTDAWNIGVGWDHFMWHQCCGTKDGDIDIQLQDKQGNGIGASDDEVQMSVAKQQWSARRLWDANNYAMFTGYQIDERVWVGGRVGYNQNAVPDYAVSPTNLDFENAGFMIGTKYRFPVGKEKESGLTFGLSYSKFFLFTREVANTAWAADVPDERFSPKQAPFNVSSDGRYEGRVDIVGFRMAYDG